MKRRDVGLDELRHGHRTPLTQAAPVELDSGDFMEGFRRKVTGSAMRTTNNGHFFDYEQCRTFSVTASYCPSLDTRAPAVLTVRSLAVIPHIP